MTIPCPSWGDCLRASSTGTTGGSFLSSTVSTLSMSGVASVLMQGVVLACALFASRVGLAAASSKLQADQRRGRLRRRRARRAEALAEVVQAVESLTSQGPEDLLPALGRFGPEWIAEHQPYVLAARALATEFRALRCAYPDRRVDVAAVQHELRGMLKNRNCREKDMIRIMPIALIMVFYKSEYEQMVEHAFATPEMRDYIAVSQDQPMQRTWWEWLTGSYSNPLPQPKPA